MTGKYLIFLGLAFIYLNRATGLTQVEQAVKDGIKSYYETRKTAAERLEEVYYYKINAQVTIGVGTSDLGPQVLVGITKELRNFRMALNKMINVQTTKGGVITQCVNASYKVDADSVTPTAILTEIPRALALYYTNRCLQCINNTVQSQYEQLRQVTALETNLTKTFLENGVAEIQACGKGSNTINETESCIKTFLKRFEEACVNIRQRFGDFLTLDTMFIGIPGLFDCVETVSFDVQRLALGVVSSFRACARRGGVSIPDPGYSETRLLYLGLMSDYSLASVKGLGLQTDFSVSLVTIEQYIEEAKLRQPAFSSVIPEEKILKALTLYSTDPTLDACIEKSHNVLSQSNSAGGQKECAQNYLSAISKLQKLFNDLSSKLRSGFLQEVSNMTQCIVRQVYHLSSDESCTENLDTKMNEVEKEKDSLMVTFRRFAFDGILNCPVTTSTTGSNVSSTPFDNWLKDIYNCIMA